MSSLHRDWTTFLSHIWHDLGRNTHLAAVSGSATMPRSKLRKTVKPSLLGPVVADPGKEPIEK